MVITSHLLCPVVRISSNLHAIYVLKSNNDLFSVPNLNSQRQESNESPGKLSEIDIFHICSPVNQARRYEGNLPAIMRSFLVYE